MTEDEAKTKWCPFARIMLASDSSGGMDCVSNRDDVLPETERHTKCIASACMAWRWEPELRGYSQEARPGEQSAPLKPIYTGLLSKTDGRCGLAG